MVQNFDIVVVEPFGPDMVVVSQVGYIDLRIAFATGEVPASLEGVEGDFNGIDDPSSIIGKPDDVFAAMRASEVMSNAAKSAVVTPEGGVSA